jgi:DNA repair protein RecO (recombination protein O)
MPHVKVKGFVIREVPVGETDRIINILTAEHGLISASAHGARRTRSPLLMATQVFALSDFELFVNKGHYTVNSAELNEAFMPLQQDLDRLVCAAHLAEVLLDSTRDDVAQPGLYRLWAFVVQALQTLPDPLLTVNIAQVRLLAEIGYAPCQDRCVVCGDALDDKARFSVRSCGTVCCKAACRQQAGDTGALAPGTLSCLRHCLAAPLGRLFNVRLSPAARRDFLSLSERYLTHQMEKQYTRLQILEGLEGFDQPLAPS